MVRIGRWSSEGGIGNAEWGKKKLGKWEDEKVGKKQGSGMMRLGEGQSFEFGRPWRDGFN